MTTRTTNHLALDWRAQLRVWRATIRLWLAQHDRALFASAVLITSMLIGLVLGWALYRSLQPQQTASIPQPTAGLIVVLQTARAVAVPTALPTAAPRLITAYDQPNGSALGPIPEPPMSAILARWGDAWLQTTWDSAPVWIMVADLGANLADVRPVPHVQIAPVVSAPATAAEQPYMVANESPPLEPSIPARPGYYGSPDELAARAEHVAQQQAYCAAHPDNQLCIVSPPSMENP